MLTKRISIKCKLNENEYKKLSELKKEYESYAEVLRHFLKDEMRGFSLTDDDKMKLQVEIEKLKKEFENIKQNIENINEQISVLINILSFSR
jgi:predicted CopG family antitoxin